MTLNQTPVPPSPTAGSFPLVSVHLISYNHRPFIEDALRSALEQNYENLEIVAGDDASTDGTAEVLRDYAARYPGRVVPVLAATNRGVTANCNATLRACQGKYIAFLAGDDLFVPGKIRAQVEWLEQDERRVLCAHDAVAFESETGRDTFRGSQFWPMKGGVGAADFVETGTMYGGLSIMVRASAVPSFGFDERLPVVSDWKFWIDCLASGGIYGYVPGVLARYRRHSGSVTAQSRLQEKRHRASFTDTLLTLSFVEAEHPHLLAAARIGRARLLYGEGVWLFTAGRMKEARRYLRAGARLDWRRWPKAFAWSVLSHLPAGLRGRLLEGTKERM
jgi:glycosyltransferase involved in cell wall biosynthesis